MKIKHDRFYSDNWLINDKIEIYFWPIKYWYMNWGCENSKKWWQLRTPWFIIQKVY